MSKKSFANLPKPGRQPTAEEIEAFEETGRARAALGAGAPARTETQKAVNTESLTYGNAEKQNSVNLESRVPSDTESRRPAKAEIQNGVNTEAQKASGTETQKPANTPTQKHAAMETRESVPERQGPGPESIVRLTIDLPESVHTRFKAACAVGRRKMVQEVRRLIEDRTLELENGSLPSQ